MDASADIIGIVNGFVAITAFVTRQSQAVMGELLDDAGLTAHQWFALSLLDSLGPLRMSEVAAHLQVSRSNVTGIVTRLERKGLVERQPDPDDRRAVVLVLSPLARRINDALREARETVLTAAVAQLSPDERAVLQKALSAIQATVFQQHDPQFLRHPE